jgi:hypothetical protein
LALINPSFSEISGFFHTKIKKAIPSGINNDARTVHRIILERVAFRHSIQSMSVR